MKQRLKDLAQRLRDAISSDTPRSAMSSVALSLDKLVEEVKDDDGSRDLALALSSAIAVHRFGDGSLSRGRDFTSKERHVIEKALKAYGTEAVKC